MKCDCPILIVEDDLVDVAIVKRAFKANDIRNELVFAGNGYEALKYLKDREKENPCIIILDINMPGMNGLEFLKMIKHDHKLKMIPVVILTTSKEESDLQTCFNLGVSGYILKPTVSQEFTEVIKIIYWYWTLNEFPHCG